jgi:hypothetical protein
MSSLRFFVRDLRVLRFSIGFIRIFGDLDRVSIPRDGGARRN